MAVTNPGLRSGGMTRNSKLRIFLLLPVPLDRASAERNMAVTNHERVGKRLELLKTGLAPFVERKPRNAYEERAAGALFYDRLVQGSPEIIRLAGEVGSP